MATPTATEGRGAVRYFATESKANIGRVLFEKLTRSVQANTELQTLWRAAYSHYYPALDDGYGSSAFIQRDGAKGELATVRMAKNRRFANAVVGIVLGSNPDFDVRALAIDSTARAASSIGRDILDSHWQVKGLERFVRKWAELTFFSTEGFAFPEWCDELGEESGVDPKSGLIIRDGDIRMHLLAPWDVAREPQAKSFDACEWLGARIWLNKWNLIARWTKDVLGQPTRDTLLAVSRDEVAMACAGSGVDRGFINDGDFIPVWYWFHRPSAALPMGREVIAVTPDCVLRDIELSYASLPIKRMAPAELFDTPFAYSSFLDGMGIQELSDGVESAAATNYLTLGVQAIAVGTGTRERDENLFGMNTYEVGPDGQMPQPLQLTKNPPDLDAYRGALAKLHEQIFGLNDVYLGNPDTAQMNAQAFALLSSMAVQANNPFQKEFLCAVGELGTSILTTYAKRVQKTRLIPIVGKGDAQLLRQASFSGEDLKGIEQVSVRAGNALEQTIPGRIQLLDIYATHGVHLQPDQIEQMIETGKIETLTHVHRNQSILIASENELLMRGTNPPVHAFDDALKHCFEHLDVLMNPAIRADVKALTAAQQHIEDHYVEYFGLPAPSQPILNPATGQPTGQTQPVVDPTTGAPAKPDPKADPQWPVRIRMLLGQQGPPMVGPPVGGPPPGGGPPGEAPPPPQGNTPLGPPGSQGITNGVQLPSAPPNPLTGAGVAGGPAGLQ